MGKEDIVSRILSDAAAEAEEIVSSAKKRAEEVEAAAEAEADKERARARAEGAERAKRITDGKSAAARLESSKIALAEKRRAIEEIYARAMKKLLSLNKAESVALVGKLLKEYAEEGDEVSLADKFAYAKEVAALPVFKEKKLKLSAVRADISGGVILRGKSCDKDLSFRSLLEADMEENVAELAARIFASANKA